MNSTKTITIPVAGMQYRVTPSTRHMIQQRVETVEPMPVALVREPDNEHDENAIKVVVAKGSYKGLHIGYVPRGIAAELAPKMDEGRLTLLEAFMSVVNADDADADVVATFGVGRKSPGNKPRNGISKKSRSRG